MLPELFAKLYTFPTMTGGMTILWHAGEPCVLPPAYYERAIEIIEGQRPEHVRYQYAIVTNGTLLDESWIPLLKRNDFHITLSIDGPCEFHDAQRRTRSGGGTHAAALRGLRLLRAHDVAFSVIAVLSAQRLADWDRYADFFIEEGVASIGFNIDEQEGAHGTTSFADPSLVMDYKRFLKGFLLRAASSDGRISDVREFRNAFKRIRLAASPGSDYHNDLTEPFVIVSVATDGGVSTFSPELLTSGHPRYGNFVFGNLLTDSFEDIVHGAKFRAVYGAIKNGVESCARSCSYFGVCRGGAPSNKLFETGDFTCTETTYCRLTQKAVLDVALELTESLVQLQPGASAQAEAAGI